MCPLGIGRLRKMEGKDSISEYFFFNETLPTFWYLYKLMNKNLVFFYIIQFKKNVTACLNLFLIFEDLHLNCAVCEATIVTTYCHTSLIQTWRNMSENPFKVTSPLLLIRSLPNNGKHISDHKVFCKDRTVLFLNF